MPGHLGDSGERPLRERIRTHLAGFDRQAEPVTAGLKAAGVAVCVVDRVSGPALLITRRSDNLRAHAGQWALPGGRCEPGEDSSRTALRELQEETGLTVEAASVLGILDDYRTRSGYVMTPVVVWVEDAQWHDPPPNAEVAETVLVPLADIDVQPRLVSIPESARPVIQLPLFGDHLHAPTAAIVYQFCRVGLHGEPTRVGHFEQPVFAWR